MSYNPAFVTDESPLAHAASDTTADGQSNGIKLTSFKPLGVSLDLSQNNSTSNNNNLRQLQQSTNDENLQRTTIHKQASKEKIKTTKKQRSSSGKKQHKSSAQNLLMSTSSSLSLIDNPALSSLATATTSTHSATNQSDSSAASSSYSPSTTSSNASSLTNNQQQAMTSTNMNSLGLCAAVECRDMRYAVGRGKNEKTILHDINVTVPEGSIYGLLGPSGCGKTTMLRCVVGRIKPRSGQVRVFGYKPNDSGSQIPGPAIGYMPQEISVYEDFTINETLTYFGKINKMKQDLIDARIHFLLNFLDLPGKNRLIASLSGGQKRRVSLAAALVHSPPLLILDEPTVGVDPLLRQSIWKHLVTLATSEKITVVITTHYIEEARQANVVGLMRNGKLLAEDSPDNLMLQHGMNNLEDVFLKLCISDSSRKAAQLATTLNGHSMLNDELSASDLLPIQAHGNSEHLDLHQHHHQNHNHHNLHHHSVLLDANGLPIMPHRTATSTTATGNNNNCQGATNTSPSSSSSERVKAKKKRQIPSIFNHIQMETGEQHVNEAFEDEQVDDDNVVLSADRSVALTMQANTDQDDNANALRTQMVANLSTAMEIEKSKQVAKLRAQPNFIVNKNNLRSMVPGTKYAPKKISYASWSKSLMAVIWKNFIRLKRNPPVLIFEFILPAVQVILFCLCIGGDPFDVPLAVVNDEVIPQASRFFLDAIDKKAIRQVPFSNLSDAIESVRRGETWGAIHIPDRYTQYLQERLTHPADITNETLSNGTINIYPDLTNLHLALAMENTFREAFIKFAKDTLNMFGYDPEAAELPIRVEEPVYGTLKRNGYLEFMAPGVVISITYVMATGLTALAFILEKRDGLLERSLVSGVTTSQILVAHASVQVLVMIIQIALVLAFTFIVFEIPSHGPFFWVILLILLQGCTGMSFGLLVSSICEEENTAVMMLVGTFYTNLILAGIIWPLEAMPRWLRWLSYAQPQTLPTETLRNILSRGWGISETGVYVGFLVTIGWLIVFLMAAGLFMRYSK